MTRLIFDIETNGLLDQSTKIHCIAAIDIDSGLRYVWGPNELEVAIDRLNNSDLLVAHNGIGFDYPVLRKLRRDFKPTGLMWDSMVLSRLIKSNTKERDGAERRLPGRLMGSHSLKAWGMRLGDEKGAFEGPWAEWSQAMQDYCVQDVEVNLLLWNHLKPDSYSRQAIDLEHRIAFVCNEMRTSGWLFDVAAAGKLHVLLVTERDKLEKEVKASFGNWWESVGVYTPKVNNKTKGYTKGIPVTKIKRVEFNPQSRQHIFKGLMSKGWKPKAFTDNGQPKVDEAVLDQISKEFPQADLLSKLLMLNKRIGQLSTGDRAWLTEVDRKGYLHPSYNTNGCVTGRASHMQPNIAQVPSVGKPYGYMCRSLFVVPRGWTMIGADQAGLEQRCLAHYTWQFDKGDYARESLESEDIHWLHAVAIGIAKGEETEIERKILRDYTKTWFYAYVYGAQDGKLNSILADLRNELRKLGIEYNGVRSGTQSRANFGERISALEELRVRAIDRAESYKTLKAIDGRMIPCNSGSYRALNYLCQSAGAILCKEWVASTYEALIGKGFTYGYSSGDFTFLGWIHDEIQVAVRNKGTNIEEIKSTIIGCGRRAGDSYKFKVPLSVEAKEGQNWAETH